MGKWPPVKVDIGRITVFKVYISTMMTCCPFFVKTTQLRAVRDGVLALGLLTPHLRAGSSPLTSFL